MIKIGNNDLSKIMFGENEVVKVYKGEDLIYAPEPERYWVEFHSESARTITPKYTNSGITLQYSINKGSSWVTIASGTATPSAKEIWFRGEATGTKALFTAATPGNRWAVSGSSTNGITLKGNIMYLLCDNLGDAAAPNSLGAFAFSHMLNGGRIINTTKLALPAMTLADNCYNNMFRDCSSLTSAPALPATTLQSGCYRNMFCNCKSLISAPALPATVLASLCYASMFFSCSSLISAPALPATVLASQCYASMFYSCKLLTSLYLGYPNSDNPGNAFLGWVNQITSAGTLYKKGTLFAASGTDTYPATWTQVAWV